MSDYSADLSDVEIVAEVFRVVRANVEKPKKVIMAKIREHLPGASNEELANALRKLYENPTN